MIDKESKAKIDEYRLNWESKRLSISKRPESDINSDQSRKSNEELKSNIEIRLKDLSRVLSVLHKIYHQNKEYYGDAFLAYVGDKVIRHYPWKDFPLISEAAAKELNIKPDDLIGFSKEDVKINSKDIHYEHLTPISFFRDIFRDEEDLNTDDFEYILNEYYKVVRITKDENDRLNLKGFKATRPIDAYYQSLITLIEKNTYGKAKQ